MGSFCGGGQDAIEHSMRSRKNSSEESEYDAVVDDDSHGSRDEDALYTADPSAKAMENQVILLSTRNANLEEELEQSKEQIERLKAEINEMKKGNTTTNN